jgi:hypothetical protein
VRAASTSSLCIGLGKRGRENGGVQERAMFFELKITKEILLMDKEESRANDIRFRWVTN